MKNGKFEVVEKVRFSKKEVEEIPNFEKYLISENAIDGGQDIPLNVELISAYFKDKKVSYETVKDKKYTKIIFNDPAIKKQKGSIFDFKITYQFSSIQKFSDNYDYIYFPNFLVGWKPGLLKGKVKFMFQNQASVRDLVLGNLNSKGEIAWLRGSLMVDREFFGFSTEGIAIVATNTWVMKLRKGIVNQPTSFDQFLFFIYQIKNETIIIGLILFMMFIFGILRAFSNKKNDTVLGEELSESERDDNREGKAS